MSGAVVLVYPERVEAVKDGAAVAHVAEAALRFLYMHDRVLQYGRSEVLENSLPSPSRRSKS